MNIKQFFKGIFTIGLYYLFSFISILLLGDYFYSNNIYLATISQIGVYLIILIGMFLTYHKDLIKDLKNFKKDNLKTAFKYWIIGFGAMIISNIIISSFINNIAANEAANRELLTNYPISNFLIMIFIAPLIEEITFRLSFKDSFKNKYIYSIITGLIFGFVHIIEGITTNGFIISEIIFLIPYSTLGFFFGISFYETKNIFTSYFSHLYHNAFCIITILLMR